MDRNQILKELKKYNFNPKKYLVVGGAALVLYGLRDKTNTIDITTTKGYLDELLKQYDCVLERINKDGTFCYLINDVINVGASYYKRRREYIEGYPVQTIEDLIELKEKLNRPKDRKDLKAIFEYIKNS